MLTLAKIKEYLRNGQYAWPGGYPMFFLCADGEPISFDAVRDNWREICRAHILTAQGNGYRDAQWTLDGVDVNWEDSELYCAHTGKRIQSAYAEPETA